MADALPWLAALSVPAVSALIMRRTEPSHARRQLRALALTAFVFSVLVHAQGAYMRPTVCWNSRPNIDQRRVWAWSDPQLLAGLRALDEAPLGTLLTEPCERIYDDMASI